MSLRRLYSSGAGCEEKIMSNVRDAAKITQIVEIEGYDRPNPLGCLSRCTSFHSRLLQSLSSKCRSCKRITGSPDLMSRATQHLCDRGSSTISTLRIG